MSRNSRLPPGGPDDLPGVMPAWFAGSAGRSGTHGLMSGAGSPVPALGSGMRPAVREDARAGSVPDHVPPPPPSSAATRPPSDSLADLPAPSAEVLAPGLDLRLSLSRDDDLELACELTEGLGLDFARVVGLTAGPVAPVTTRERISSALDPACKRSRALDRVCVQGAADRRTVRPRMAARLPPGSQGRSLTVSGRRAGERAEYRR